MGKEWRPDNWKQPYKFPAVFGNLSDYDFAYEHGAANMLAALREWLIDPCTDEHSGYQVNHGIKTIIGKQHRKDCPQCLQELWGN
jgi:hypothetical protein